MASEKPTLKLILAPIAVDELDGIWRWNAQRYSPAHADGYVRYLKQTVDNLATTYARGNAVAGRPGLRYVLIRRRNRGHGHVAVYSFDDKEVNVLHVFHSAQDWPTKVAEERP